MGVKADPTIPSQFGLDQNSRGASVLQSNGISISGGSTVTAPGVSAPGVFTPQPGTPTSKVYLGQSYQGSTLTKNYKSFDEANLLPTTWSQKELRDFVNKGILYKAQGFSADMGMPEIIQAWGNLVDASQLLSKSGTDWSPNDVLESYNQKPGAFGTVKDQSGDWLLDARTGDRIKYIGPRSKTTTESRVDLSSPEDVRAITTQTLTQVLGRAPTAEELAKYRTAMGAYEQAHPGVATTTTTLNDKGEEVSSNTTTSGGVDDAARQSLITEQAKKGPEYGKFQSATTYFNAMMQMMGG